MRYLSWLFIVFLMYWSWSAANTPLQLAEATHIDIQNDIKVMITQTIYENLPDVENFRFDQFWTENKENGNVRAEFKFSFDNEEVDGEARYGITGYATLIAGDRANSWVIDKIVFNNDSIQFKDGMVINKEETNEKTGEPQEPTEPFDPYDPVTPDEFDKFN